MCYALLFPYYFDEQWYLFIYLFIFYISFVHDVIYLLFFAVFPIYYLGRSQLGFPSLN